MTLNKRKLSTRTAPSWVELAQHTLLRCIHRSGTRKISICDFHTAAAARAMLDCAIHIVIISAIKPLPLTSHRKLITLRFKIQIAFARRKYISTEWISGGKKYQNWIVLRMAYQNISCCDTAVPSQFHIFTFIVSISKLLLTAVDSD